MCTTLIQSQIQQLASPCQEEGGKARSIHVDAAQCMDSWWLWTGTQFKSLTYRAKSIREQSDEKGLMNDCINNRPDHNQQVNSQWPASDGQCQKDSRWPGGSEQGTGPKGQPVAGGIGARHGSSLRVGAARAGHAGGGGASQGCSPRSQQIRAAGRIDGVAAGGCIGRCRHHASNPWRPLSVLDEGAVAGWLRASAPPRASAPWPGPARALNPQRLPQHTLIRMLSWCVGRLQPRPQFS